MAATFDDLAAGIADLRDTMDALHELVKAKIAADRAPQLKGETVTFSASPFTVDFQGYRHMGVFVPVQQSLTVMQKGYSYTIALQPGYNLLVVVDGAEITTNTNLTGFLVRSNYKLI